MDQEAGHGLAASFAQHVTGCTQGTSKLSSLPDLRALVHAHMLTGPLTIRQPTSPRPTGQSLTYYVGLQAPLIRSGPPQGKLPGKARCSGR